MRFTLLDIGSTSIKCTTYDPAARVKGEVAHLPFPDPDCEAAPLYEVDPMRILAAVREAIATHPSDALCVATQMHGYLLGDGEGQAITPYISWRDERSLLVDEEERYPFSLPATRGVLTKPNLPLASLYAMERLKPDTMRRARSFYTLGSFVAEALTGESAAHITDLAPTGLYDACSGRVESRDFPHLSLPRATTRFEPVGRSGGMAVYAPVGDHQASVLGGGLDEGHYLLNIGTAAQLCAVSKQPMYGEYESRPYFGGRMLLTVTRLTGGRTILHRMGDEDLSDRLIDEYSAALRLLPARSAVVAVGGVCAHQPRLVEAVLKGLGLPYEIRPEADALDGLIALIDGGVEG